MIESFRELPGTVEIVGLGGVSQPGGETQEADVAVLVASDMDAPGHGAATRAQILKMGCGQLDLLVPGSQWRAGAFVGQAKAEPLSAAFELVREERLGTGADPQPKGRPFPSRAIASAPGFLLRRVRVGTDGDPARSRPVGPDLVLLPQMELLRSLFGVSNGFLLQLFDGIRNPAVSGERGLVNRDRSRLRDDGTVVLAAGRNLSRDEALIAAAVIADPAMRRLHDSAFQQLSVSPEWHEGRSEQIKVEWPWKEPIRFELEGRWVARVGAATRFIVTRIVATGVPMPFTRVEVHHPGAESDDCDNLPPPEGRTKPPNARLVVLTTGRAGSPSRRPVEIATRTVDLLTASGIEVESIAHGGIARHDKRSIGEKPRDEAPFGTGGRQSGADAEVGSAKTKRRRAGPGEVPARSYEQALDATWNALHAACQERRWALDALPRFGLGVRGARHGGLDLPREPLVARVAGHGARRVLVADRGSSVGDECSLGILVPKNVHKSDRALAVSARKACDGVGGRWRSGNLHAPDFDVISINRSNEVWEDPDAFADLLVRRLASALGV